MKSFITASLVALGLSLTVSGATCPTKPPPSKKSAGALYFLTDHPSGNNIIVSNIWDNGTVSFAKGIPTGGLGARQAYPGPDPITSQNCILVDGDKIFAVNPGSNTISTFAINPSDPTQLTMIGKPVNSGGDFPVSIAVSPKTGDVCVANTGVKSSIQCFHQSSSAGLTSIPNTNRPLGLFQPMGNPPLPFNTISQVLFSSDGGHLIGAIKGNFTPVDGYMAAWTVTSSGSKNDCDKQSGRGGSGSGSFSLSQTATKIFPQKSGGGGVPFGMTTIPNHRDAFIVSDPALGYVIYDFSKGYTPSSAISKPFAIPQQNTTCWVVYSQKTGTFFMTDGGIGVLNEVKVDGGLKGSLVKQYQQDDVAVLDEWIVDVNGKEYLYVLGALTTSVLVFDLPGPGAAQRIQSYNFKEPANKAGITIDANFVQGMTAYIKKN